MKTLIITLLVIAGHAIPALAQGSNLIFFAPEGEPFYVIINGIRQNEEPQTNVKVTGIAGQGAKVKVIFADTKLGEVDKNIFLDPAEPIEATCQVVYNEKKGEYQIKYFGMVPIAQAPPTPASTPVVVMNTTPMAPISTTTISTTTTTGTTTENVNVGVNMMGVDFGMNVTINDPTLSNTTTTTTTTTTNAVGAPAPQQNTDHYIMPGYNGAVGCPWPMSAGDFSNAKQSIATKSFEDSKVTVAKQIFGSNCMTSDQVKQIMEVFTYEDSKLDFAKYAYGRTFDLGNYYKVNDAFTYETSIDELNEYIQGGGGW